MLKTKIELSIVIPVYNSSNNLIRLIKEIFSIGSLKKIKKEVILVNDFSNLQTQILLNKIKKKYKKIKIINLKKNSGQHYSTLVGIDHSRGKFIATLDDDLELTPLPINSGFTFSCTGIISLIELQYSCCEGTFPIIMSKQNL